jgi:hypothetical protein
MKLQWEKKCIQECEIPNCEVHQEVEKREQHQPLVLFGDNMKLTIPSIL